MKAAAYEAVHLLPTLFRRDQPAAGDTAPVSDVLQAALAVVDPRRRLSTLEAVLRVVAEAERLPVGMPERPGAAARLPL